VNNRIEHRPVHDFYEQDRYTPATIDLIEEAVDEEVNPQAALDEHWGWTVEDGAETMVRHHVNILKDAEIVEIARLEATRYQPQPPIFRSWIGLSRRPDSRRIWTTGQQRHA
jgi:hypothetical protein